MILKRALRPFQHFVKTESAGGVVLLLSAAVAILWANSPWSASYFHLWETPLSVSFGEWAFTKTIHHWINDGLMVVFFLLVGLEIKRELLVGELMSFRQAALPVSAAVGGVVLPALLYVAFNAGREGARGWAIPMATDIAFALGVLALLGSRIPTALKVYVTALAIVDDLVAVLVIAVFFSAGLSWSGLAAVAAFVVVLALVNRMGVNRTGVYLALGVALWIATLGSGLHATIAGILLAATIPASIRFDEDGLVDRMTEALDELEAAPGQEQRFTDPEQQDALHAMQGALDVARSPLMRLEQRLHAPVAFVIMPLFALANAGVNLGADAWRALNWFVFAGVVVGLVAGKAIGIAGATRLAVRFGIALPLRAVSWRGVIGASWLGGIGFTMSLFIAGLAFTAGPLLDSAKTGILVGSVVAGVTGWLLLRGLPAAPAQETATVIRFPGQKANAVRAD